MITYIHQESVVRNFEDCELFNAGKGSVFTRDGKHELDASIMVSDLRCGAVSAVTNIKNPITLARKVMEETQHVHITAQGAERFADGTIYFISQLGMLPP